MGSESRCSRDHYTTLGLLPGAPSAAVQAAYRRLARRYHPDVNTDPGAARTMRELNEAYRVLSNPGTRARYDASRVYDRGAPAAATFVHVPPLSNFGQGDPLLRESLGRGWLVLGLALVLLFGLGLTGLVFSVLT